MSDQPQPTPEELKQLISLVTEANHVGHSAAAYSAERLRKCVEAGSILLEWKSRIPKGQWSAWLDEHLPEDLNDRTRRRWMSLANLQKEGRLDIESAKGLRHAYQLAQLLPDGDASGTKQSSTKPSYLVHLSRLITSLGLIEKDKLTPLEKSTLIERLEPIQQFVSELQSLQRQ